MVKCLHYCKGFEQPIEVAKKIEVRSPSYGLFLNTLVEFATATKAVPMSSNTASHMDAIPMVPRKMNIPLITNTRDMFCQTILRVCFAMETASANFKGESVISTTSAVSIATSEPRAPIATPTSDRASLTKDHAVLLPLDRFGIHNLHMTVLFRPTDANNF